MTFREKLADWISGGSVTLAKSQRIDLLKTINRMERVREDELRREVRAWNKRESAIRRILAATENGKSGTAQKIARIAREALE
jgi:hypothetical protein